MTIKTYKINSNLAEYTDEEFSTIENLIATEGVFDVNTDDTDLKVTESTPNAMTVDVAAGAALVTFLQNGVTWKVVSRSNAVETASISANSSGSNRVDAIVIHLKQDEPNALKNNVAEIRVILGSGVSALTDSAITTSLGDANWYRLADVTVPHLAATITNSDITDTRTRITLDALPTDGSLTYVTTIGDQTISGTKTFQTAFPEVASGLHPPTTDYQIPDKKYVDDSIIAVDRGIKSLPAGEAVDGSSTPQCVYVSDGSNGRTAGRFYKADADDVVNMAVRQIGFVVTNAATPGTSYPVYMSDVVPGFTGLTQGVKYFLDTTAGAISKSGTSNPSIGVGYAISATQLLLLSDYPVIQSTTSTALSLGSSATQDLTIDIGFRPRALVCQALQLAGNDESISWGEWNNGTQNSMGMYQTGTNPSVYYQQISAIGKLEDDFGSNDDITITVHSFDDNSITIRFTASSAYSATVALNLLIYG